MDFGTGHQVSKDGIRINRRKWVVHAFRGNTGETEGAMVFEERILETKKGGVNRRGRVFDCSSNNTKGSFGVAHLKDRFEVVGVLARDKNFNGFRRNSGAIVGNPKTSGIKRELGNLVGAMHNILGELSAFLDISSGIR